MSAADIIGIQTRIREVREARGMSLGDLAKASDLSKPYIWTLETGKAGNPTVRAIWLLADALGVTPAWLLGLDANASPIPPIAFDVAALIERHMARANPTEAGEKM